MELKVRVCEYDGDCPCSLGPVSGADGMLGRKICNKPYRNTLQCAMASALTPVSEFTRVRGVDGYCGGYKPKSLLVLGGKSIVDFLPKIRTSEYWILYEWARDFASRGIPFFVRRRFDGVALYKRAC